MPNFISNMTPDDRRAALDSARAVALSANPQELLKAANLDDTKAHQDKILFRLRQMPKAFRRRYLKAMTGRSAKAATSSLCYMCVGWQRAEVPLCTDPACPLFPYRPTTTGTP